MNPLVLGLNSSHPDSSAVLMNKDGPVAAICEERINRLKHCSVFPRQAIHEVLRLAGASIEDVTDITIARDPKANLGAKMAFVAKNPRVGIDLVKTRLGVQRKAGGTAPSFAEQCGVDESRIRARTHNVEHHVAHIASAFYWSGFDRATGISVDGSGDWCSVMIARCEGREIEVLHRTHPPHSLGMFYTALCGFLGFRRYGEEYKVMGLAAYGEPAFLDQLRPMVRWDPRRGVVLDDSYFTGYSAVHAHEDRTFQQGTSEYTFPPLWSRKVEDLLGKPRERGAEMTQRDRDLAASLQRRFEEVYMEMIRDAVARTGIRDVVMAGGCALNGVGNGRVVVEGLVDRVYIHPAAGDDGTGAGAASYVLHNRLDVPRHAEVAHAYWGTGYTDAECEAAASASGLPFRKLSRDQLLATAADALARGSIIGWFQGREEWGPRALGNRSILCNPGWPDMKAILNARVKNREPFRPFAPAILHERLSDCFEGAHEVPFMNIVYKVRPEWRERLSATTHEDNTGRVQTVKRTQNELYYDLISAFNQRTGIPVLLNTSFNENEPIVHTPTHAIDCFKRTRMSALAVGPFWYEKPATEADRGEAV